jgi:hypothetical protein
MTTLGHGSSQASLEGLKILDDLATSQKTLPEAEDSLEKAYNSMYQDSIWHPALTAITGSETTEAALDKLAKFKAAENGIIKEADKHVGAVETELMDAVSELKGHRRIFGALPSLEDLVNPPGKLEIGEDPEMFKSDADIIEEVRKRVGEEEGVEDEIEECLPPQMSRLEMARLSESLRSVCLGSEVEAGYELLKVLRRFEAQIRALELQKSTQQKLDAWLDVGATRPRRCNHTSGYTRILGKMWSCIFLVMHNVWGLNYAMHYENFDCTTNNETVNSSSLQARATGRLVLLA